MRHVDGVSSLRLTTLALCSGELVPAAALHGHLFTSQILLSGSCVAGKLNAF